MDLLQVGKFEEDLYLKKTQSTIRMLDGQYFKSPMFQEYPPSPQKTNKTKNNSLFMSKMAKVTQKSYFCWTRFGPHLTK